MVKISAVEYLNTKPFIYGIEKRLDKTLYSLSLDIPSICAEKLISGKADLGLVPVAVIPELKEHHIISGFCIGAEGAVSSVMLYSEVPLPEIEKILLDYQSRTSVQLVKVLAKENWKIKPVWVDAQEGFEKEINGKKAGLIIGDRTFSLSGKFKYLYDLAGEWKKFTGLPFVFACWIANKKLSDEFVYPFNSALQFGIENRKGLIEELKKNRIYSSANINDYLLNKVSYELDEGKKQAMKQFLELTAKL